MRVDVVMPQMGESIAEGTITRWIRKVGERIERDEPIFEISTDKVDAEIPAPASGILSEIRSQEGETVAVNSVVAVIETEAGATANAAKPSAAKPPAPAPPTKAAREELSTPGAAEAPRAAENKKETIVSPVVRRIADEHGLDPQSVPGTGAGGRVTKRDILNFLEREPAAAPVAHTAPSSDETRKTPSLASARQSGAPVFEAGQPSVRVPMTQMRKKIAEHMIESRRTSAHVHSVFEVDMTCAVRLRERHRQIYSERHGTKLTYMAFFIQSICDALHAWPVLNSSLEGQEIVYKKDLHIGIAVALEWGLIVPVIRNADELSIVGLCKRVNDLADRARTKSLSPDEVHGGTFTITNPGSFGGLYGLPIINQPQVAILGIGGIKKRPVVIDDAIAIRSMMYMSMSYDHRVVDGSVADQFLAQVQHSLENFDESLL